MSERSIYEISGSIERNLAAIDLMWEKAKNGEPAVCFHDVSFEDYDSAVLYAARTPLNDVNTESAQRYKMKVSRRETGGSTFLWRPNDMVLTATSVNPSEDMLEGWLGESILGSLENSGAEADFEVKNEPERRSIWADGMPVSSFSSRGEKPAVLSGYIAAESYDEEMLSNVLRLRPGEKQYIREMPGIEDLGADIERFEKNLRSQVSGVNSSFSDKELYFLDRKEGQYRDMDVSERNGSKHRGFCPVYRKDLEDFREDLEQSSLLD